MLSKLNAAIDQPHCRHSTHSHIGAGFTALLFNIGKFLIGLYIGKTGVVSGFGAAGSVIAMVLWVYYSAQIFLLGAEFTWIYAKRYGSRKATDSTPQTKIAPSI